jgi:hypothetical protein
MLAAMPVSVSTTDCAVAGTPVPRKVQTTGASSDFRFDCFCPNRSALTSRYLNTRIQVVGSRANDLLFRANDLRFCR